MAERADKKTIKLKETDWYSEEYYGKTFFYRLLAKNYDIEISDNPDYVLYGPCGLDHLDYDDAVKIFVTGECVSPDFNVCDYAITFEHIDFGDRHLRFPLWLQYSDEINAQMEEKHRNVCEDLAKRKFCAFVVSNGNGANSFRNDLFEALSKYRNVDSGGRYRNNIGKPEGVEDKIAFQSEYKFSFACENCIHDGYTTEKIVEAFASKTIPIYWGDPRICETFNPKSFINCNNYDTIEDIVEEIKKIDQDDELYLQMLREPALVSEEFAKKNQIKKAEAFLCHIIEQDKDAAFRRNRIYWGKMYADRLRSGRNALKEQEDRQGKKLLRRNWYKRTSIYKGLKRIIHLFR